LSYPDSLIDHIQNILTFRYDPNAIPAIPEPVVYSKTVSDPDGIVIEQLLKDNIKRNLKRFETIVFGLSSGIDSVLLLYMVRDVFPKAKILTITQAGVNDESDEASYHSEKCNAHHFTIGLDVYHNVKNVTTIRKDLFWNIYPHVLGSYTKLIHSVLVLGDGGDEFFAGYSFRYKKFQEMQEHNLALRYMNCQLNDWVDDQDKIFKTGYSFIDKITLLDRFFKMGENELESVLLADINGKLLRDAMYFDFYMARYYHIKLVTPLLDKAVMERCLKTPINEKCDGKVGKLQLRNIAKRYGLEFEPDKKGYVPDILKEFKTNHDQIKKTLLDKNNKIYKIINYDWVNEHVNDLTDKRYVNKMFQLLVLEKYLWYKRRMK